MNIYIEADVEAQASRVRQVMSIVEWKPGMTKTFLGKKDGTYNEAVLKTLVQVMGWLIQVKSIGPEEAVIVCSKNTWIPTWINTRLVMWRENGYKRKDGQTIKNADLWQKLVEYAGVRPIEGKTGAHSYYRWMTQKMKSLRDREVPDQNGIQGAKTAGKQ